MRWTAATKDLTMCSTRPHTTACTHTHTPEAGSLFERICACISALLEYKQEKNKHSRLFPVKQRTAVNQTDGQSVRQRLQCPGITKVSSLSTKILTGDFILKKTKTKPKKHDALLRPAKQVMKLKVNKKPNLSTNCVQNYKSGHLMAITQRTTEDVRWLGGRWFFFSMTTFSMRDERGH